MLVKFRKAREIPKTVWISVDFRPHRTKGVFVSYDTSSGGQHSRSGLPGRKAREVDFGGDWMIRTNVSK